MIAKQLGKKRGVINGKIYEEISIIAFVFGNAVIFPDNG